MDESPRPGWTTLRKLTRVRVHQAALWILGLVWVLLIVAGHNVTSEEEGEFRSAIQENNLHAWDRFHRMNAVLEHRSAFEKWIFGYESPADLEYATSEALEKLAQQNQLDERGKSAMETLALARQHFTDTPAVVLAPGTPPSNESEPLNMSEWRDWEQWIADGHALWWESAYLIKTAHTYGVRELDDEFAAEQRKNEIIYQRVLIASGAGFIIFLAGVVWLPRGLRGLRECLRDERARKVVRYSGRISLSLLLLLLLSTELFNYFWIAAVTEWTQSWQSSWWLEMGIDSLWRLLPALVILGVFYRKPDWVARSFELWRRPQWAMILAVYALLIIADYGLYHIMLHWGDIDPTEHVDVRERGWMGLVYGLVSACILAPVAEEFIYRGLLFRGMLRKCGFVIAAGFSTTVFSVVHFYDAYGTISVGLFGLAAAVLYLSTRSLTNAIILHAIYNLTITVPTWMLFHSPL